MAPAKRWGNRKLEFLRRFLPFAKGVPSHDTLNDVIIALREAACDMVAIDGKTSRRSPACSRQA